MIIVNSIVVHNKNTVLSLHRNVPVHAPAVSGTHTHTHIHLD